MAMTCQMQILHQINQMLKIFEKKFGKIFAQIFIKFHKNFSERRICHLLRRWLTHTTVISENPEENEKPKTFDEKAENFHEKS